MFQAVTTNGIIKNSSESFSDRVDFLLAARGCTKVWLAKELGISKQLLNSVLKNNKSPKYISEIALAFNVNPEWLKTGVGKVYLSQEHNHNKIPLYALEEIVTNRSINTVKQLDSILFNSNEGYSCFAVLFSAYPSMQPKFEENSILIFNQNLTPQNGSFVLAVVDEENIVFRQYQKELNLVVLSPLNNNYKSITCTSAKIIGVLTETRIRF